MTEAPTTTATGTTIATTINNNLNNSKQKAGLYRSKTQFQELQILHTFPSKQCRSSYRILLAVLALDLVFVAGVAGVGVADIAVVAETLAVAVQNVCLMKC